MVAGWTTAVAVVASVVGGAAIVWPALVELEVSKCERPKFVLQRKLPLAPNGGRAFPSSLKKAAVEIRRYAPILMAEVDVDAANMKEAGGKGFRALAGFIFGKNIGRSAGEAGAAGAGAGAAAKSEKVAMTSPVIMEVAGAEGATKEQQRSEKVAMTSPVIMEVAGAEGAGGSAAAPSSSPSAVRGKMAFTMPSKYTKDTLPSPLDSNVRVYEKPARTLACLQFRGQVRTKSAYEGPAEQLRQALASGGIAIRGPLEVFQYHPPFTWGFMRVNEVAYEVSPLLPS